MNVLPDVEFGPVGKRENPDAFALVDAAVIQIPQFRTLILGIPLAILIAEGEDPLLGAGFLLVAPGAAECDVESTLGQSVEQGAGLQKTAALLCSEPKRAGAFVNRLPVGVNDQPRSDVTDEIVAERDHFMELVCRVDVQQRKRNLARVESLLRQPDHHRRVLPDGVKHDGPGGLRNHLAQNVDTFGFEGAEVR